MSVAIGHPVRASEVDTFFFFFSELLVKKIFLSLKLWMRISHSTDGVVIEFEVCNYGSSFLSQSTYLCIRLVACCNQ